MDRLFFQTSPHVTIATNIFINVPTILKFEETNLIEVIKDQNIGYTTQIPIYHPDGTLLATAKGNRLFLNKDNKANLTMNKLANVWECKRDKETLFEIHIQQGDSFKISAELYTPEGYFVKFSDQPSPELIDMNGNALNIGRLIMAKSTFRNVKTAIWMHKNGGLDIGVNI